MHSLFVESSHPITTLIPASTWSMIKDKFSPCGLDTLARLIDFVENRVMPSEALFEEQIPSDPALRWKSVPAVLLDLQQEAKVLGLWNLFMSKKHYPEYGVPLSNLEYAVMAEVMGRSVVLAPYATNCNPPETGNMELLALYGTPAQKKEFLEPLLDGSARSAFSMTEPAVASSDGTNISTVLRKDGNDIIINGHKWWISNAGSPRCKFHILMGRNADGGATRHTQHSIVLVPADAPGVTLVRPVKVFGYDDAPEGHMEVIYKDVRVPASNLILGWGRGFEVMQGRLGPGRIHHYDMRLIGVAQRALDIMLVRVTDPSRKTFGKQLSEHGAFVCSGGIVSTIAECRMEIDQARLLVLTAANRIDDVRAKGAMLDIGIAKAIVPAMVCRVVDRAMQSFGAAGVTQDNILASSFAHARTLRFADGPDEVHIQQIGKIVLKDAPGMTQRFQALAVASAKICSANSKSSAKL